MVIAESPPPLFDRVVTIRNRDRCMEKLDNHAFLIERSSRQIMERLEDIKRRFPLALSMGVRGAIRTHPQIDSVLVMDIFENPQSSVNIRGDEEFLPVRAESLDLAISLFGLQNINDLPGTLLQIRQALKPDGLFIAAMPGGETLNELRESLTHAELSLKSGLSPRVHPTADKQQMGALLQRAGFALPVVDSDIVMVTYQSMFDLLHDIRGMGESNALTARNRRNPGRTFFSEAARYYTEHFREPDGKIRATFEIIHLIGWAPHTSQPKPLRPGSAEKSLAEELK
ncbi:MAG: methyltransferase domain-containing protein [Alphaproteobacteria bacterium]|nr:methyltransferase domain-containing protein [Alphaproteobacteria bacterium]